MVAADAGAAGTPGPFAVVQAVPLPDHQVSFQCNAQEVVRYRYDRRCERPFWFPLVGPGGCWVTRMGHPHDPMGHRHHNSVWISHQNVNGVNFWEDPGPAKIVQERIEKLQDGPESASMQKLNAWLGPDGKPILRERRRMTVRPLADGEWMLCSVEVAVQHDYPI